MIVVIDGIVAASRGTEGMVQRRRIGTRRVSQPAGSVSRMRA
jgi:hypothetical protein